MTPGAERRSRATAAPAALRAPGAAPIDDDRAIDDFGCSDHDDDECSWCSGEGMQDCDDPLGCTMRHYGGPAWRGGYEDCHACGGSGLAKDQTLW